KGLEEERRLAYVGITRAERLCVISFAANRPVYGRWQSQIPSRFIDELPAAHVEVLTPPGLAGGARRFAAPVPDVHDDSLESRVAKADVYNAPGWQRMQRNAGASRPAPAARAGDTTYAPGERVFHQKFGTGTVVSVDGDKLGVAFDRAGDKHIVSRFVVPADGMDDVPF
ncbi:MAG: DNA helicase II, partial [Rhodobacteraceae bacterium]|nr:DNA helicase II [Paracoccaceae bacterium]